MLPSERMAALRRDIDHPIVGECSDEMIGSWHGVSAEFVTRLREEMIREVEAFEVRHLAAEYQRLTGSEESHAATVIRVMRSAVARAHEALDARGIPREQHGRRAVAAPERGADVDPSRSADSGHERQAAPPRRRSGDAREIGARGRSDREVGAGAGVAVGKGRRPHQNARGARAQGQTGNARTI